MNEFNSPLVANSLGFVLKTKQSLLKGWVKCGGDESYLTVRWQACLILSECYSCFPLGL